MDIRGQIELCSVMGLLRIAYELPVHMDLYAAADTQKRDDMLLGRILHIKEGPVETYIVHLVCRGGLEAVQGAEIAANRLCGGDVRWIVGKRIADIQVHGMRITTVLPDRRNIDCVELHAVCVQCQRQVLRVVVVFEVPITVQALHQ